MGVALALAAALCYACGSVIEHQVARQQRPELSLRLGLLVALARQPLWVIGFLVGVGAYCLEAAALAVGNVMTVAPLLVSGLLFALPLASHRSHRRMTSGEWAAAVALTGALAVFVTVGAPTGNRSDTSVGDWLLAIIAVATVTGALVTSAMGATSSRRALRLGTATGVLYGLTAVLTKTTTALLGHGVLGVLDHWQPYALAAASGVALVLNQSAFQAGQLAASLPAISVVNPVIAALLGAALFGERLGASGPLALAVTAVSAIVMAAATISLARSPLVVEQSTPPDPVSVG